MAIVTSNPSALSIPTVTTSTHEAPRPTSSERNEQGPEIKSLNGSRPPFSRKAAVVDHPLAQHALTTLRNRETTTEEFRAHCNQLLLSLAFEASRTCPMRAETVEPNSPTQEGKILAKPIILLAITRDALGLAHGLAKSLVDVHVGSISHDTVSGSRRPEPRLHIFNSPVLSDSRIILFDPIIATGLSATLALNLVRRSGASDVSLISFVASAQGLERIQGSYPDLAVWTAAIDTGWDAKQGPLPGIWNFAERMYA